MLTKRKQWAADSMTQTCNAVKNEQMGLREAAHKYNIPVETLKRRTTGTVNLNYTPGPQTTGTVSLNCKPGPQTTGTVSPYYRPGPRTVLTTEEEAKLAQYQGWSQALGTSRRNWNCLSRIMNCSLSYISGNTN